MSGGGVDAQAVDLHRSGPLAGTEQETYHGVPPVKQAPFDLPHIPVYFWVGGIAAGAWLAATAEEWAGERDRDVVRAGRYLTLGSVTVGTGLLIADLGRPDRFLNMLRVFRPSSAMSLGSWALASFGAFAGLSAMVQAAEDGLLGDHPVVTRLSTGGPGRGAQALGLPAALFVGSYTGTLLSSTATPTWARRAGVLSPLFTASGVANGLAAVDLALELAGGARASTRRRLSRAQTAALAAELALEAVSTRESKTLPSAGHEGGTEHALRWVAMAGMIAPLAVHAWRGWSPDDEGQDDSAAGDGVAGVLGSVASSIGDWVRDRLDGAAEAPPAEAPRSRSAIRIAAAGLALTGGLALRWLTVAEGETSAGTPEDTWTYAGEREGEDVTEAAL